MLRIKSLASILASVAQNGELIESKADGILSLIKSAGIKDLEAFNDAVQRAYLANGWQPAQGAPKKGSEAAQTVPSTVKQYVSQVRAGFRLGLPMAQFKTIHAMRKAIRTSKPAVTQTDDPVLAGVRIANRQSLIGAPFHDLAAVYGKLPKDKQARLVRAVKAIVQEYGSEPEKIHLRIAA